MSGRKREHPDWLGVEDPSIEKCKTCRFAYIRKADMDEVLCSRRKGCIFLYEDKAKEGE